MTNNKAPRYSDKYLLFLQENICCVYSLEVPHLGSSGEECNIRLQISVESLLKSIHNIYVFEKKKKKTYLELIIMPKLQKYIVQ